MVKKIEDTELARRVVEENSADALKTLVKRYMPMIRKQVRLYEIRIFENSDWEQEAYIVCHETCFRFDGSQGSKFGSFFRLKLSNHFKSLVRKELAVKRKFDKEAERFSDGYFDNSEVKAIGARQGVVVNDIVFDMKGYCELLSEFELKVFMMLLGTITAKELRLKTKATQQQIYRAQSSCREKMLDYLR